VIAAQIALDNAQKTGRTTVRHYSGDIDPALVNARIRRLRSISMCPAHDLLLEGIDLMLKKRGRPSIAALTKKE
jgi:hypothetical protein